MAEGIQEITLKDARKLLPDDFSDLLLTPKELKFVAIYLTSDFNKQYALTKAGYKTSGKKAAENLANNLLKEPHISEAIKRFVEISLQPYKDKLELELFNLYYRRAFYNVGDFYGENGVALPIDMIPKEWMCCIDGVERKRYGNDTEYSQAEWVVVYALPNRDTAIRQLWQYVGQIVGKDAPLPSEGQEKLTQIYNFILQQPLEPMTIDQTLPPIMDVPFDETKPRRGRPVGTVGIGWSKNKAKTSTVKKEVKKKKAPPSGAKKPMKRKPSKESGK